MNRFWASRICLLALGLVFATSAQAHIVCYPAKYGDLNVAACLETPGADENSNIQRSFEQSTTRLLQERYSQKGTTGGTGPSHLPADNSATCTIYEVDMQGSPDFSRPIFTIRAYWETERLSLPSHSGIEIAQTTRSESEPAIDPARSLEIGEFAISYRAKLGLTNLKMLLIAVELFDRSFFRGKNDLVLTTRAHLPGGSEQGPWERLYRFLGFRTIGTAFRHPRFPDWWSIAMRRTTFDMKQALQNAITRGEITVAAEGMPLTDLNAQLGCQKTLQPLLR